MSFASHWGGQHPKLSFQDKFLVRRVPLDSGGYTRSGHYFGRGLPLFQVTDDGDSDYVVNFYVRGKNLATVKNMLRAEYPQAKGLGSKYAYKKPRKW